MNKRKSTELTDEWGAFTAIPNQFLEQWGRYSDQAKVLFVLLRYHTNTKTRSAFPSYDQIKLETGWTPKTIVKAVRDLEAGGWLERRKQFSGNTHYILKRPSDSPAQSVPEERTESSAHSSPEGRTEVALHSFPEGRTDAHSFPLGRNDETKDLPSVLPSGQSYPQGRNDAHSFPQGRNGETKDLVQSFPTDRTIRREGQSFPQGSPVLPSGKANKEKTEINKTDDTKSLAAKRGRAAKSADEKADQQKNPFFERFAAQYAAEYEGPYVSRQGDFVQLAELRRRCRAHDNWDLNAPASDGKRDRYQQALDNYFASDMATRTFADFCARFSTFFKGALDRFGQYQGNGGANGQQQTAGNRETHNARATRKTFELLGINLDSSGAGDVGADPDDAAPARPALG